MERPKVYNTSHSALRKILRELPEYQIEKIIDIMKITGREREIMVRYYLKHESIDDICDALNISKGSYHLASNKALRKIELSLSDIEIRAL